MPQLLVPFFTGIGLTGSIAGVSTALIASQLTVGIGASLLSTAISGRASQAGQVDVDLNVAFGDELPLSFVVGDYVTGGKRKYIGSWGRNNRYITEVIEYSCLPQGLTTFWVNDEPADIDWGAPPKSAPANSGGHLLGIPAANLSDDGSRIWVRVLPGTQTAADATLVNIFGSDPDYPWTAAMVGKGKSYVIVTTRYDSDTLTSYPSYLWQPAPLALYDVRADTTAGGSGPQRWDDPATWQPTRNPAVIAYNVARGIYYGDEWIFGGRNLPAWRLPVADWVAAANACDELVDDGDSGTEPIYRAGAQITVDQRPADVLEALGLAANMRFVPSGGMLRPVVGVAAAPVLTITDADVVITQGQTFTPFKAMGDSYNALSATYPEPGEKWASKDAPEYIDPDATAADGGQYRPTSLTYSAAPYAAQVQRLMRSQMADYRRERFHTMHLPPACAALEPGDVIAWTSARNGYTSKLFSVESIAKAPAMLVSVSLREVDPADYDPPASYVPVTITPPAVYVPAVQPATGFTAVAATVDDGSGPRRPAILTAHDGDEVGVTRIRIQARRSGDSVIVIDTLRPFADPWQWYLTEVLPATAYEVRGMLLSDTTPLSDWSDWIAVTTGAVYIGLPDLDPGFTGIVDTLRDDADALMATVDFAVPRIWSAEAALDEITQALLDSRLQLDKLGRKVTDAGIVVDPATGLVQISAIQALEQQVSTVGITVDGVAASLSLYATQTYVNQAVSEAVLSPEQIPIIGDLELRIGTVEVDLDAAEAAILLKASQVEVDGIDVRLGQAEIDIDAAEAAITLKANQSDFNDALTRLNAAEIELDAMDAPSITFTVQATRQLFDDTDDALQATLGGLLQGYLDRQAIREAEAAGTFQIRSLVTEGFEAEAAARLALQAEVDTVEAGLVSEQTVRAAADAALSQSVTALQATVNNPTTGVTATAGGLSALTTRVTAVEGTVVSQTAQITSLSSGLSTTNANVDAAQDAAQDAYDLAGSKGKVLVQSTTPATADRLPQNLWIDTTGGANTPKRWNGSAWVAVTDKVATDAAAAAASALAQVATKAEASALSALDTRVTNTEGVVSAQASSLTALTGRVGTAEGAITTLQSTKVDAAGAVSAINAQIAAEYGSIGAMAEATALAEATAEGLATAGYVFRARAGGAVGEVELVAASDPVGGASSLFRVSADRLVFEGGLTHFGGVIQSSGFVSGTTGWRIQSDGSAEFNGPVISRQLVVDSGTFNAPDTTFSRTTYYAVAATWDVDVTGVPISGWAGASKSYIAAAGVANAIVTAGSSSDAPDVYWGVEAVVLPLTRWEAPQTLRLQLRLWAKRAVRIRPASGSSWQINWKIYEVT